MCKCLPMVNEKLTEYNGMLEINMLSNPSRAMVSVCKIISRGKKPPLMEASFCPFCGKKYPKSKNEFARSGLQDTIGRSA